jgi:SAM-dependent methyltransferase
MGVIKADIEAFNKLIPFGNGICLDVGCGKSQFKEFSEKKGYTYIGLDISRGGDIVADAHHLPFREEVFATAVSLNSLEHLINPQNALNEVHRVLGKSGRLFIMVPFMSPFHTDDYWRFTPICLKEMLREFKTVEVIASTGIFTFIGDFVGSWFSTLGLRGLNNFIRDAFSMLDVKLVDKLKAWAHTYLVVAEKKRERMV